MTFDRSVNIKDICWNLNNLRVRFSAYGGRVGCRVEGFITVALGSLGDKLCTQRSHKPRMGAWREKKIWSGCFCPVVYRTSLAVCGHTSLTVCGHANCFLSVYFPGGHRSVARILVFYFWKSTFSGDEDFCFFIMFNKIFWGYKSFGGYKRIGGALTPWLRVWAAFLLALKDQFGRMALNFLRQSPAFHKMFSVSQGWCPPFHSTKHPPCLQRSKTFLRRSAARLVLSCWKRTVLPGNHSQKSLKQQSKTQYKVTLNT